MNKNYSEMQNDMGTCPFVTNVAKSAVNNSYYRTALWTGCYSQMTLMCIPVYSDIGLEVHNETEQFIRIEQGFALVKMGECTLLKLKILVDLLSYLRFYDIV